MEKIGEVRAEVTPCDVCSNPATAVVGSVARCDEHKETPAGVKSASGESEHSRLKSFTEPLEEEA